MPLLGAATVVAAPQLQPVDDVRFVELASEWLGVRITVEYVADCRVGRTADGQFVVLTADYATPRGYRGPTSLMLLVNSDMSTILNAALVESCDSPAYVRRAVKRGLIEQYKGRHLEEQVPLSVDAVSGATRTCMAVEESVNQTLKQLRTVFVRTGVIVSFSGHAKELQQE
jgi:uncharacterized protein with FMN-binding domain